MDKCHARAEPHWGFLGKFQLYGAGKDGGLGGNLGEEVWAEVLGHWEDVR